MGRRSRQGMVIRAVGGLAALVALQACGASSGTPVSPATGAAGTSSSPAASPSGGSPSAPGGASSSSAPSVSTSATSNSSATSSSSASSSSSATTSGSASPSATASGTTAGTPECRSADLHVAAGPTNATAGTFYLPIRFTNTGSHSCEMVGFPGVSYLSAPGGSQVGDAAERQGPAGSPVVLRPGQTASAIVGMVDVGVLPASSCRPTSVAGLRVYPPDQTASVFAAHAGKGCAGHPGHPQLTVRAVRPGAGTP